MLSHVNVGSNFEIRIKDLAKMISNEVQYKGEIIFDDSKPDGSPRKLMDSNLINQFGWRPEIQLQQGITETYDWFLKNKENFID